MESEGEPAIYTEQSEQAFCERKLIETTGAMYDNYIAVDAAVVTPECETIAEIVVN